MLINNNMKLSWSHKLFFKINSLIGRSRLLDSFSYFCAHVLIYILGAAVLIWGVFVLAAVDQSAFIMMIKLLLITIATGILISYTIAIFWKHPRPIIEFPEIKKLLSTSETWKSFPSDHTMISFIFAFVVCSVGAPIVLCIVFLVLALMVAVGRVFVGVHYPRDIVGGLILASIVVYFSPWILEFMAQPMYDTIKLFFQ
jgi:undecaprenyl-diphosphatase